MLFNELFCFLFVCLASLLFTYVMFEVYTVALPDIAVESPDDDFPEEVNFSMDTFVIEKKPAPKELAVKVKPKVIPTEFIQKKDNDVLEAFEKEFVNEQPKETIVTKAPSIESIPDVEIDEDITVVFNKVEFVPVFPGCETLETNEERASCFSEKVKRIVSRKFNTGLGSDLGLEGVQRIYVQFEVYKDGTIQNVKARAAHRLLEKEATRVVQTFPRMTPGKQRDRDVTVKYHLPIMFKIHN